jgi:hypothetical protein
VRELVKLLDCEVVMGLWGYGVVELWGFIKLKGSKDIIMN